MSESWRRIFRPKVSSPAATNQGARNKVQKSSAFFRGYGLTHTMYQTNRTSPKHWMSQLLLLRVSTIFSNKQQAHPPHKVTQGQRILSDEYRTIIKFNIHDIGVRKSNEHGFDWRTHSNFSFTAISNDTYFLFGKKNLPTFNPSMEKKMLPTQ